MTFLSNMTHFCDRTFAEHKTTMNFQTATSVIFISELPFDSNHFER